MCYENSYKDPIIVSLVQFDISHIRYSRGGKSLILVVWLVKPCVIVHGYHGFGRTIHLHIQGIRYLEDGSDKSIRNAGNL
jgi:hypothetical protein